MNIVLASDNKYVQHCAVTMTSIISHNDNVHFYIITDGISNNNKEILNEIGNQKGGKIDYCYVDEELLTLLPMPKDSNLKHISKATYYRLFLDSLLPKSVEKVLYLDCDIIVRGNLMDLWNIDLTNYAIAAVFQPDSPMTIDCLKRLDIPYDCGYFNAGVQMINRVYWQDNHMQEQFMSFLKNNYSKVLFHDQDVMNAVMQGKVKCLSLRWNMFLHSKPSKPLVFRGKEFSIEKLQKEFDNGVIIHYTSSVKPWVYLANGELDYLYYEYLNKTVFKDFKPKFNIKRLLNWIKSSIRKI